MTTRKNILFKRRKLSQSEVNNSSDLIITKLLNSTILKNIHSVFVYYSYNNEVNTLNLINKLLEEKISVSIPWTSIKQKKIVPVTVDNDILKNNLVKGPYGILQPDEKIVKKRSVPVERIDVCICPGSLFDRKGGRIGYGAGYYDRFLADKKCHQIVKIGLCFDFQLFDQIEQAEHDIKMDYIFTEEEIVEIT